MWENNEYRLSFGNDAVKDYERAMLSSGKCSHLLPVIFIGESLHGKIPGQTAYYDCMGFLPLSRYSVSSTDTALSVLERVLIILESAAECLLSPGRFTLTGDTVFCHPETGEIKIAYVPLDGYPEDSRRNILVFIALLKRGISDGQSGYLDRFAVSVHGGSYRIRDLITRAGLIRRELQTASRADISCDI